MMTRNGFNFHLAKTQMRDHRWKIRLLFAAPISDPGIGNCLLNSRRLLLTLEYRVTINGKEIG